VPPEPEKIIGKNRKEKMDLISRKTYIPGFCTIKMKTKNTKNLFHLPPYSRKLPIPLFLGGAYLAISGSFSQYPIVNTSFPTPPFESPGVIGLVRKNGSIITGKEFINHLGVMDICRSANKLSDKLVFGIYGKVVFVAIDSLLSLFGEGGIRVAFSRVAGGFNQSGINNLSALKLKAFFSKLAFEFVETFAVEVLRLEIGAEPRYGGMVGNGIVSRKAKKTTVEEVAVKHDFHFSVRVAVDLLDDENFEHKEGIIGRATHRGRMKFGEDTFEGFPVDKAIKIS